MQKRSKKFRPRPDRARQLNADLEEEKRKARPVRPVDAEKMRERTMQRAVKLLAAKPRSVAELRERLLEKQWTTPEVVDGVLARLGEYGYLDDERFAFGFASYRVRQKPVGRQRLARDLQTKKVSRETAEQALELVYQETPEEELIERAIEKRIRLRGRPTTRQETKSLYEHLLRLGFSYDLIIRKVRDAATADTSDDVSDAETAAD
ncbi:MAG TPA: regulatory protein RecX [Pyrinomonadaceae bacterium]|nr:regulatory protein RecX [Pyrinomonadaceae bacterium]